VIRHAVALPVVHVIDRPLGSTDQSDSSLQSNHPSSDADLDEEESELRLGGSSSTPYGRQLEQAKLNQKLISWDLKKKDMSGMQMQLGSMHISAKHQLGFGGMNQQQQRLKFGNNNVQQQLQNPWQVKKQSWSNSRLGSSSAVQASKRNKLSATGEDSSDCIFQDSQVCRIVDSLQTVRSSRMGRKSTG
jgi:hypothetical protein